MRNKVRLNVFYQVNHSQEKYKASHKDGVFQFSAIKETISNISDEDKMFCGIKQLFIYTQRNNRGSTHLLTTASKIDNN